MSLKCFYLIIILFSLFLLFVLTLGMIAITLRNKMLHDRYEMLVNASLSNGSDAVGPVSGMFTFSRFSHA